MAYLTCFILFIVTNIVFTLPQDYDTDYDTDYSIQYDTDPTEPTPAINIPASKIEISDGVLDLNETSPHNLTFQQKSYPQTDMISAKTQAIMNIMEKIMFALGPDFQKGLPKVPKSNNDTIIPTIITPINTQDGDSCPAQYTRCSSQAYYPSCKFPSNIDPQIWGQKFNLYFDLSEELSQNTDTVLNATLRLYKNYALPLVEPSSITVKLFSYSKNLGMKIDQRKPVKTTEISSDYIGWVWIDVGDLLRNIKHGHNHGFLITVHDFNFTWHAPSIFVTMDCESNNNTNRQALPFEVPSNSPHDRFPALNVVTGFLKLNRYYNGDGLYIMNSLKTKTLSNTHQRRPSSRVHNKKQKLPKHSGQVRDLFRTHGKTKGHQDKSNKQIMDLTGKDVKTIIHSSHHKSSKSPVSGKKTYKNGPQNPKRLVVKERIIEIDNPDIIDEYQQIVGKEILANRDLLIDSSLSDNLLDSYTSSTEDKGNKMTTEEVISDISPRRSHHTYHKQTNKARNRNKGSKKSNRRKNQRKSPGVHNP